MIEMVHKTTGCRTRICSLLFVLALLPVLAGSPPRAHANGWEHAAIPFSALLDALADASSAMRYRAALSLGYRGEQRATPALLEALARPERSPTVRSAIYDALGSLGDRRALEVLESCLLHEQRDTPRAACVQALGRIAAPSSLPKLLALAQRDQSELVQIRIIDALGQFDDPYAVAVLMAAIRAADDNGNANLRAHALAALGKTGAPDAGEFLLNRLRQYYPVPGNDGHGHADEGDDDNGHGHGHEHDHEFDRHDHAREARIIIAGLGRMRLAAAELLLQRIARDATDRETRLAAIIALGKIDADTGPDLLVSLLNDADPAVRLLAMRTLGASGDTLAADPLITLVQEEMVRLEAMDTSALLADAPAALISLSLQLAGLRALIDLDPVAAGEVLAAASRPRYIKPHSAAALKLSEGFYEVRRLALHGLGYSKSAAAGALLRSRQGIGARDPRIRMVSLRALGMLEGAGALPEAVLMMDDSSAEVRRMAAILLGRLQDMRAAAPLIDALGDNHALVRQEAALGLGYLAAGEAEMALSRLAETDPDGLVRDAARYALARISGHVDRPWSPFGRSENPPGTNSSP